MLSAQICFISFGKIKEIILIQCGANFGDPLFLMFNCIPWICETLIKYVKKEPWFSQGLLHSSLRKNYLHKVKLKSPTEANINAYKTHCTLYTQIKRKAKREYYVKIFEECKCDVKRT